jgi:CspA family cold shock protein
MAAGDRTVGVVKFYRPEKGWGAISCVELPDGLDAWVHFSVIQQPGYRQLSAGEVVDFEYEAVVQDSFRYRATRVWRREPADPVID